MVGWAEAGVASCSLVCAVTRSCSSPVLGCVHAACDVASEHRTALHGGHISERAVIRRPPAGTGKRGVAASLAELGHDNSADEFACVLVVALSFEMPHIWWSETVGLNVCVTWGCDMSLANCGWPGKSLRDSGGCVGAWVPEAAGRVEPATPPHRQPTTR